jgi:serine protease AprX
MGTYAMCAWFEWVVLHKNEHNIRVLNMSMYATPVAPYWSISTSGNGGVKAGIVVIASAGNNGPEPLSVGVPGNTPYIITVGSFTDNYTPNDFGDDYIPEFSAAGPTLDAFVKPDVIAPGAHMSSLMRNNTYLAQHYPENRIRDKYFNMSGTSMSTAVVSGITALMLHDHPNLTPDQVKYRLSMTARPQFSEATGEMAYSIWQQGAGRV